LVDLQSLARELDLMEHSIAPSLREESGEISTKSGTDEQAVKTLIQTQTTGEASTIHPTSSAEYIAREITRHKKGAGIALTVFLLALAGVGVWLYKYSAKESNPAPSSSPSSQVMKVTRLSSTGKVTRAAVSPDGRYVVHVVDDGGQQSLWMRQTATQSNVQIVVPAKVRYYGLTFSTDGNYIYYVKREEGGGIRTLYQTPVLGGSARKVWDDVDSPVTFSPDGKQFAFVRVNGVQGETSLVIANTDGSGERKLATHKEPETLETDGAAWSPDGKTIVCGIFRSAGAELIEVMVEDGAEKLITSHRWGSVGQVAWLPDNSGFVINAADESSGYFYQMSFVSRMSGEPRRITNDLSNYQGASLTADANTLLTVQSDASSNLWIAPDGDANRARQITSGKYEGYLGVAWTPDNKIVSASKDYNISMTDPDGSNQKLLFGEHNSRYVAVSPDNRYIVLLRAQNAAFFHHL
jgi:Tol biopolymer transport system component